MQGIDIHAALFTFFFGYGLYKMVIRYKDRNETPLKNMLFWTAFASAVIAWIGILLVILW